MKKYDLFFRVMYEKSYFWLIPTIRIDFHLTQTCINLCILKWSFTLFVDNLKTEKQQRIALLEDMYG